MRGRAQAKVHSHRSPMQGIGRADAWMAKRCRTDPTPESGTAGPSSVGLYLSRVGTDRTRGHRAKRGRGSAPLGRLACRRSPRRCSFGANDAYVIVDMPDNVSLAAAVLAVNSSGGATAKTVVLLTPEEVDEACRKRPDYQPPGS